MPIPSILISFFTVYIDKKKAPIIGALFDNKNLEFMQQLVRQPYRNQPY